MQSTLLANYCQSFENEIQSYNGNKPLDIWSRYIDGVPGNDEATKFNLILRCIKQYNKKKEYHNNWSFVKICILYVTLQKNKLKTMKDLYNLGIGREEGLFYKLWAELHVEAGQIEEARAIYEEGLKLSKNHADFLKTFHGKFLERHPFEQKSTNRSHGDVQAAKFREIVESNKSLASSAAENEAEVKKPEEYSIEELMATYWRDGKCRSQKRKVEAQLITTELNEIRRKSTFGSVSIMENITEESESYQTNNTTFSPLRTSIHKEDVSILQKNEINWLPSQTDRLTSVVDESMDATDDDDDDDEETMHGKIAEEFLVRCFYRPSGSTPRKSDVFSTPKVEIKKACESFFIYEDPQPTQNKNFTIFEDPEMTSAKEKSQKTPKLKERGESKVMERENIPPEIGLHSGFDAYSDDKAKFIARDSDASFTDASLFMPQFHADKSIADTQGFLDGVRPGRTSTKNVTEVFKKLKQSNASVHLSQPFDLSMDRSKEKLRHCYEEDTMTDFSMDNTQVRKNLAACFGLNVSNVTHSAVECSILADAKALHIDDFQMENMITREPTKMDINDGDDDDDVFHDDPFPMNIQHPRDIGETVMNMQDFFKGLKPDKTSTQNVTELFKRRESTVADFLTAYETPLNDGNDPVQRRERKSTGQRWRRCSTAGIAPLQPVHKKLAIIMDEDDDDWFNLSTDGVARVMNITGKPEYVPPVLSTSFANMSIVIDTENPYNEETIKSFIARLRPPLNNYAGFHEVGHAKMPVFRIGSVITLGINKFLIKKILGEGAFAKAYHLNYLGHGDQYKDCVAKIQRPPCPLEFYITRELHKRVGEIVREEKFVDVTPSLMQITEAYVFEDGSLFLNEMHEFGTLLDLINLEKSKLIELPQWFVMILCYELVCLVDAMHRCSVIHGDLKPDNVLVRQLPLLKGGESIGNILRSRTTFLKVIDFGQSIDMGIYPPGTEFTAKSKKKDLQCIEMKVGKSWSYHIDLYFLAGLMYVLMMGNYMNPELIGNKWSTRIKLKRSWDHNDTIKEFFDMLINVKSPNDMPKLQIISDWLLATINVDTTTYNAFIRKLTSVFNDRK